MEAESKKYLAFIKINRKKGKKATKELVQINIGFVRSNSPKTAVFRDVLTPSQSQCSI